MRPVREAWKGFTRCIATELARRGVTANAVAPGFIQTDMTEAVVAAAGKEIKKKIPARRLGAIRKILPTQSVFRTGIIVLRYRTDPEGGWGPDVGWSLRNMVPGKWANLKTFLCCRFTALSSRFLGVACLHSADDFSGFGGQGNCGNSRFIQRRLNDAGLLGLAMVSNCAD